MKNMKKLSLVSIFVVVMLLTIPANATTTNTATINTSTWSRTTTDKVTVTLGYSFGLDNNYTALKLFFVVYPNSLASGNSIGSFIVDYANYNHLSSGTTGTVTSATDFYVYDTNAESLEVLGGDPVYTFLYIYNSTVTASNLIKKSTADLDYFPEDGRYGNSDETDETDTSYFWWYVAAGGVGVVVLLWLLNKYGIFSLYAPKRDTLVYQDGRKAWAVRNKDGSFKDIQDPKRAMNRDRATPHRYKTGADRRPRK